MCGYFPYNFLSETFFILRTIQWEIQNVHRTSRKMPNFLVKLKWKLNFVERFSNNTQLPNFMKIRLVGNRVVPCGRTDVQTWRTWCFSDRASWIDYTLITNLMHWLLFIHKILFSSTCFEPQVLIFRRIQLYTCSVWYCHSVNRWVVEYYYNMIWLLLQSENIYVLLQSKMLSMWVCRKFWRGVFVYTLNSYKISYVGYLLL